MKCTRSVLPLRFTATIAYCLLLITGLVGCDSTGSFLNYDLPQSELRKAALIGVCDHVPQLPKDDLELIDSTYIWTGSGGGVEERGRFLLRFLLIGSRKTIEKTRDRHSVTQKEVWVWLDADGVIDTISQRLSQTIYNSKGELLEDDSRDVQCWHIGRDIWNGQRFDMPDVIAMKDFAQRSLSDARPDICGARLSRVMHIVPARGNGEWIAFFDRLHFCKDKSFDSTPLREREVIVRLIDSADSAL